MRVSTLLLALRRAHECLDADRLLEVGYRPPVRIQDTARSWEDFDSLSADLQEQAWKQLALEARRKTDGIADVEGVCMVPIKRPALPERKWTPRPMDPRWQLDDIPLGEYIHALTGTEIRRGRRANCPFPDHDDHSRDFAVTRDGTGFCCYGCNRGGTIFQFAGILWGYRLPLRGNVFCEVRDRLLDEFGMQP